MKCKAIIFALLALSTVTCAQSEATRISPGAAGISSAKLQAMETAITAGEFKKIGSILIARHGKLVYEHYFDGDASTLRDTRSATKSITDILIGIAIEDKKLNGIDARILDLLPGHRRNLQNPDPRKNLITVEDLLTMSSVLECNDWNNASRGNEERMYLIEDWAQFILDLPIHGGLRLGEKPEPPKYGRDFSYCTGGVFTLSEVITRTTGMRTDKYAQQKLFGPLDIKPENVLWFYSPLGIPQTGGGLRLTSRDLLKIPQLFLNGGTWPDASANAHRIVSEAWIKASTSPHAEINDHQEYGYLWWLQSFGSAGNRSPAFFMTGNGGNKVLAFPELDLSVVITTKNFNLREAHDLTDRLLNEYVLPAVE
jgi:CubicO group peptidase (beta-lactamase class C family)